MPSPARWEGEDDRGQELQAIHADLASLVQRRLRTRMLEDDNAEMHGLPHAPTAYTRVLERSITMSPRRPQPRHGTRLHVGGQPWEAKPPTSPQQANSRSASSPPRSPRSPQTPSSPMGRTPGHRAQSRASHGRQTRPKSAPTNNMRNTQRGACDTRRGGFRSTLDDFLCDDDDLALVETLDDHNEEAPRDASRDADRDQMTLQRTVSQPLSDAELEEVLALLQSRERLDQLKGIERMLTMEYTPADVQRLTQHGHLDALCALTAVFLRQQQQRGPFAGGEDIETVPGFRALQVMFKMGAVSIGFRAVAAAIVALAMPQPRGSHAKDPQDSQVSSATGVEEDVSEIQRQQLPSLSELLEDKADPLKLGDIDDHQHLTWNLHSLNGLPHRNRSAVESVAQGAQLWVYTMARAKSQKNAFQTYVQLLPTGSLYIGGKEQQVSVLSVVQGSTPELDGAFNVTGHRRACMFRVQAMPRDWALAACEPVSLAFGTNTIEERDLWIHGISVIVTRSSAESSSSATSLHPSQPVSVGEQRAPTYKGACDAHGVPCGHGTAISTDGTRHIGEWQNGMLSGLGALLLPSGEKYMGGWEAGLAHGVGVHLSTKDARYEGEWVEDARHGYGIESNAEGLVFCGSYVCGQRHGEGILVEDSVAQLCTYDNGTLVSASKVSDADATQRVASQRLRRIAAEAAAKAKTAALETSRLLIDIESAQKQVLK